MGICGMGGVGKTTVAKRFMNRVREEHLFDEVLMVVVGQQMDMLKIQGDIADSLGLKLEERSLSSRAHRLKDRLAGGKRILIALDDVWKKLELEDLGIHCGSDSKGCTILLTSRNEDVLNKMDAQKVCKIETLSETDAWFLFKKEVGACVDDQSLLSIAQEIVKKCKGLPIAIVNVAAALKDKKNKSIWDDALRQLKSSNPTGMPEVLEDVYKPLKLSYDFLGNRNAKSIFLLCCLFPEDVNIPLEDLAVYAMGLRMFEDLRNLEEVRNRTYSLVDRLKGHFLLLEGTDEYHVRIHDVVRDVSIFIASDEGLVKNNDCTWISPYIRERTEISMGLVFPKLRLLLSDELADKGMQISDHLFEGMAELNVLSMKSNSLRSLPYTMQLLKNLQTLILYGCRSLQAISVIGELAKLEILICHHCHLIEELPVEIGRLRHLILLDLSYCENLKVIRPGIISGLVRLEELKMVGSFDKWEAEDNEGKERKNAGLKELESLSNLTCLEIEVEDSTLATQQIHLSPTIVKYNISIGGHRIFVGSEFAKKMELHLPRNITLGKLIHECVGSAEFMVLEGDGSDNLDFRQAQSMRWLIFRNCSTKSLVVGKCGAASVFPLLEHMSLEHLDSLEEICDIDGPISEVSSSNYSFRNLKMLELESLPVLKRLWRRGPYQDDVVSLFSNLSSIHVHDCGSLHNLFPLSTAKDCFPHLESLKIWRCDVMEQVFLWNEGENEKNVGQESRRITIFPKLKSLQLYKLQNLTAFCKGIESIECPLLTEMEIDDCPQLKTLVSGSGGTGHDDDDNHSLHLLCKAKVSFDNLKELRIRRNTNFKHAFCPQIPIDSFNQLEKLEIEGCGNIRSLFSSSIAKNLGNLRNLIIENCKEMVKVIEDNEENGTCEISTIHLFSSLKVLHLRGLPRLKSFCEWRCYLELPSLEEMSIINCPKMERSSFGSLSTPNPKTFEVAGADILNTNQYFNIGALQIEELVIRNCQMLEQVVLLFNEEENGKETGQSRNHRRITFPKLKTLGLHDLPSLTTFCKGIESIEFPLLTKMQIQKCPNLKSFVSTTSSSSGGISHDDNDNCGDDNCDDNHSSHLFCSPMVVFGSLKRLTTTGCESHALPLWCHQIPIDFFKGLEMLEIEDCGKVRSLFSSSVAANLVNLKSLSIKSCKEMVKVIEDDGEEEKNSRDGLFPRLERIDLHVLKSFCEWRSCALIELPSLERVRIYKCPKMESFVLGSLSTPDLRRIDIDDKRYTGDLNGALQQHFLKAKEEESTSSEIEEEKEEKEEHI